MGLVFHQSHNNNNNNNYNSSFYNNCSTSKNQSVSYNPPKLSEHSVKLLTLLGYKVKTQHLHYYN